MDHQNNSAIPWDEFDEWLYTTPSSELEKLFNDEIEEWDLVNATIDAEQRYAEGPQNSTGKTFQCSKCFAKFQRYLIYNLH